MHGGRPDRSQRDSLSQEEITNTNTSPRVASKHRQCLLLKIEGRRSCRLNQGYCCSLNLTWREHSYMRGKHKLAGAVFRSRDRLAAQGASPLLVQLFCLTQGRQARTFNSHTKHTHPLTFSFKPNTQTPARKGMLGLSWPEKHAFLMAPLPLLRS